MREILEAIFGGIRGIFEKAWIIGTIVLVALLVIGLSKGKCKGGEVVRDTIYDTKVEYKTHRDTITEIRFINVPTLVYRNPIKSEVSDTLNAIAIVSNKALMAVELEDTTYNRETIQYSDSSYSAWVSGVDARLDSIRTFDRIVLQVDSVTRYNTIYEYRKSSRKHWSVSLGVLVDIKGNVSVGGSVGFKLFDW